MKRLRVKRIERKRHEDGYAEPTVETVQQLGYDDTVRGFIVLDEEIVPEDILISLGAIGSMGRPWESKFKNWIPTKQGGRAEHFQGN